MSNIDKMVLAASFVLSRQIAWSAQNALKDLGLSQQGWSYQQAYDEAKLASPLFVDSIEIKGRVARNMYDEHPGYCYFYSDASECVEEIPAYCSITLGMEIAFREFTRLQQLAEERDEVYDGDFTPSSIVLVDQFGGPLMEYASGRWQEDLAPESEWPELLAKANRLSAEASEESRWDNFETSRSLTEQADALRRRVVRAKSFHRAIH